MRRNQRLRQSLFIWAALLVAATLSQQASAQLTNLAVGKPVIDGSGSWDGGVIGVGQPFNGGTFPATRVTDGSTNEATGAPESYWLGREGTVNEYFTLDLTESFDIDRIDLFNTHNRQFNDRGTGEFVITGAQTVDGSNQLVDPFFVLSGDLSDTSFQGAIVADSFSLPAATNARYLRFEALTFHPTQVGNVGGNVGLNEIQVFNTGFVSPNKAFGKPVIDGSGSWDGGVVGVGAPFDGGPFPATTVTDGSTTDAAGSYWLGREGVANETFTLDLEEVVNIEEILLRNTSNAASNDRGTMDFRIFAAESVDGGNALVNPVEILSGKLGNTFGVTPSVEHVFTAANGLTPTSARYLQFETLSSTYFTPHYAADNNVGLNEIAVYDEVLHEPTPLVRDNIALGKPIIAGTPAYPGEPGVTTFDGGDFPATRVTDGSVADVFANNYWLGREFTDSEYFVLDLGELFTIDEIALRNTHNTQFNDRGTEEFVILASSEVDGSNELVDPFPIVSGTLSRADDQTVIEPEVFSAGHQGFFGGSARYLQFIALTHYSTLGAADFGSAGLNEIEVYGTVIPEPASASLALLGAMGLMAGARRRKRMTA